ncbi:preprotein translocase subunit YajC [Leucobacter zeae]|nr:preprotein translocase subunit YajC [Leucobacter zeae]
MDPITLMMFALIAVLIFFMFRNNKKRRAAQEEMQNNLRPGAEIMLQSGIFATIESVDDEQNRATVRSGDSTLVVHRNAIAQVVAPVETPEESGDADVVAPDDDPAFGERIANGAPAADGDAAVEETTTDGSTAEPSADPSERTDSPEGGTDATGPETPKA